MHSLSKQNCRMEQLDARVNMSVEALPGTGSDLQFLSDLQNDTTPVVSSTPEQFARVPLEGGYQWLDGTMDSVIIRDGGQLEYVMVDSWHLWPSDPVTGVNKNGEPSETNIRWLANYAAARTDLLVIDIENWAMDIRFATPAAVNVNIARFENIIRWVREEQPDLKVGIYSIFPLSEFYHSIQYELYGQLAVDPISGFWYRGALPSASNNLAKLQNANVYLTELSTKVDYVMPALYTNLPDEDLWRRYAVNTIVEARRYGKPVIPFIMPTYHQAANLNLAIIAPSMWQLQMDTLAEYGDGGILWCDQYTSLDPAEYWIQMAVAEVNGLNAARVGTNSSLTLPNVNSKRNDSGFGQTLIDDLI